MQQTTLFEPRQKAKKRRARTVSLRDTLRNFNWEGQATEIGATPCTLRDGTVTQIETFTNEFWTRKQRQANSLHEISYRACFKPQLPKFFITRLTKPGDRVYDPFSGRGTTPLETALLGRVPVSCDINPLSDVMLRPRLSPIKQARVAQRLEEISLDRKVQISEDLLVFFHPETLQQITALKQTLLEKEKSGTLDSVDQWIRMVALNRLTGHSSGFFSVYSLPPNQAVSVDSQRRINEKRKQTPPKRDICSLILRKTRTLLKNSNQETRQALGRVVDDAVLLTEPSHHTSQIASGSVSLVVTSPPFLDVVNYKADNWLRCWFCGIDTENVAITQLSNLEDWKAEMTRVFRELRRVLKRGAYVAFEVGEVRSGTIRLEEHVIPCGIEAGLKAELVMVNAQSFTKTANCWGVENNSKGTNSNRIVVFRKGR